MPGEVVFSCTFQVCSPVKQHRFPPCTSQVQRHFRPEFVNRIDEFISFDSLDMEQIAAVVRLQVHRRAFMRSNACLRAAAWTMPE